MATVALIFTVTRLFLEEGATGTYSVSMDQDPGTSVNVSIVPDSALGTSDVSTLTFTSADWNMAQPVVVTAVDDASSTFGFEYTVTFAHACDNTVNCTSDDVSMLVFDDDACVRDCEVGSYSTSCNGTRACVPCEFGYKCAGACDAPVACDPGEYGPAKGADACETCATGTYTDEYASRQCADCPAGYKCTLASIEPCPTGTYSLGLAEACDSCPLGRYAPNEAAERCLDCPRGYACEEEGVVDPEPCAPGFYAVGNATLCTACPSGYACPSTGDAPMECARGAYSLTSWQYCVQCPAGERCSNVADPPTACEPGTSAAGNATVCADCAFGTFANTSSAAKCATCPRGHSCYDPAKAPERCPEGTYAGYGAGVCLDCPAGRYADHPGSSECEMCPPGHACANTSDAPAPCANGTYSTGNAVACDVCALGFTSLAQEGFFKVCDNCPAGYSCGLAFKAPQRCAPGSYSQGAKRTVSCDLCPPGFECPDPEADPVPCGAGTYAGFGFVECAVCEAGFECPDPQANPAPEACGLGNYSVAMAETCTACEPNSHAPLPGGFQQPASTCVACPAGRYATSQQSKCTDCPVGFYCVAGEPARPCLGGRYSEGSTDTCFVCPAGAACSSPAGRPVQCPAGKFAQEGGQNCTSCAAGYKATALSDGCDPCAAGYYCPFEEAAIAMEIPCPLGTYSEGAAAACLPCPAGFGCRSTVAAPTAPDDECGLGTYAEGGREACTSCPAGMTCPAPSTAQRIECPSGSYSPTGEAFCRACPPGQFCPTTTIDEPVPCPAGTYAFQNATQCTVCEPGYACPLGGLDRHPCGIGTYSTGGATDCGPCEPGYRCGNFSTSPTPAGSECVPGTYCNPATELSWCPPGTYGNTSAGRSVDEACAPCDAGYFCPDPGTVHDLRQVCPVGAYCPTGSALPTGCPDGFYGLVVNAKHPADCEVCPPGYACSWELCPTLNFNISVVQECGQGFYCPTGSTNATAKACPGGTSSTSRQLASAAQCTNCSAGYYCPPGTIDPIPCAATTYNPLRSTDAVEACRPCEPGYLCPDEAMWRMTTTCAAGYYCPAGSETATACPVGRFSDSLSNVDAADCTECPAGFACDGATRSATMLDCVAGHYCPSGTPGASDYDCPGGRYSSAPNLEAATDCTECPAGSYCSGGGTAVTNACTLGHYCPNGTQTPLNCPAGRYGPATGLRAAEGCTECEEGYYCDGSGLDAPVECPAGSFASFKGTRALGPTTTTYVEAGACVECYAGFFCPLAATAPQDCGVGFHSAGGASRCDPCKRGHYCGSNTTATAAMLALGGDWASSTDLAGRCFNGTYCDEGTAAAPDLVNNPCPAGHYCPTAVEAPVPCSAGTWNAATGQDTLDDCQVAPEGSYTLQGAANVSSTKCAPGHYCPAGSVGPMQVPCPERFYLPDFGGGRLSACALCVSGGYCPEASAEPVTCPAGFYCSTGVSRPEPCTPGTYGNGTGLRRNEDCTPCPAGSYCDGFGLAAPRGPCDPGYYCLLKSYTSAPHAPGSTLTQQVEISAIGGLCPAGGYCPLGSAQPAACPNGTYNNYTGGTSAQDCKACTPGYYCAGTSNPAPSGPCLPGYYCDAGAASPTQNPVPPGFFSIAGATAPTPCRPGTYQPFPGQARCLDCQAGRYCDKFNATAQLNCPLGFYCVEGTSYPEKCPAGTYGESTKLESTVNCTKCEAGYYCDDVGATAVTQKPCDAGFWCGRGSSRPRPVNQLNAEGEVNGDICPVGHYCPQGGTENPVACPNGTYSPGEGSTGTTSDFACEPCKPGWACNETGLGQPIQRCAAGYFCAVGAKKRHPWYGGSDNAAACDGTEATWMHCDFGPCPAGYDCPEGTGEPKLCPEGTYANETRMPACAVCPPGAFCDGNKTTVRLDCPEGKYCPSGTGTAQPLCPVGSFGQGRNLTRASDCTPCRPGSFCSYEGLTAPNGACLGGYYCPSGSVSAYGESNSSRDDASNGPRPCPAGSYCPPGSPQPEPCPNGTYSGATGLVNETQCRSCTAGSFCPRGSPAPAGLCKAGRYCDRGWDTPNGDKCPQGTYCIAGSTLPTPCQAGTFAADEAQGACDPCPAGSFCQAGTVTPEACPAGFWCDEGTKTAFENPCPQGTWSNKTGRVDKADCVPAIPGTYAQRPGNDDSDGSCDAGYYCYNASRTPRPTDPRYGGECGPGENCPAGTPHLTKCPGGSYCKDGRGVDGPCNAGYYCVTASYTPTPRNLADANTGFLIADVCPAGHFCPAASVRPTPCPPGTFSTARGNTEDRLCVPCLGGYACPANATAMLTDDMRCPPGFYCPNGTINVPLPCPRGRFCPLGAALPTPCAAGTYQPRHNASNCTACPRGFYCDAATSAPQVCPEGFYCPLGTAFSHEFHCPRGSFSDRPGLDQVSQCQPCSAGTYCETMGLTHPTGNCSEGFYCRNGSKTKTPRSVYDFLIYENSR